MAAISLVGMTTFPNGHTATAATTWQEFALDPRAKAVTVHNEDDTIKLYVAFDNMGTDNAEQPADGGAVGTHRLPLPAGQSRRWEVRDESGVATTGSVFVASASGTPTYTVEQELV